MSLIELTQYELGCIGRQSVKLLQKYAGLLYPRWLWGLCIEQSQVIVEIRGGDTGVVVALTTVQCPGYRAAHAQLRYCTNAC